MLRIAGSVKEELICEVTWTCGCGGRPEAGVSPHSVIADGITHVELTGHTVEFRGYARKPWHVRAPINNSGRPRHAS